MWALMEVLSSAGFRGMKRGLASRRSSARSLGVIAGWPMEPDELENPIEGERKNLGGSDEGDRGDNEAKGERGDPM